MKTPKQLAKYLPSVPTKSEVNPSSLCVLMIGEPKWGKSTFFTSNPKAVLLAFETGHKFLRCMKIEVDKWDHPKRKGEYRIKKDSEGVPHMTAQQALRALEASENYDMVIIDTIDSAAKMCQDYHCAQANVEDPSEMGDFGKGWNKALNKPMRDFIQRILKTGRGVGIITHSKTEVARFTSGEKARKEATIGGGVMRFVYGAADVMLHGEFGLKQPGNRQRDRILVCEGEMDTLAGNRTDCMLPARYIVDKKQPWKQFSSFFKSPDAADQAEAEYKKVMKKKK